jgi:hypothetical protein
VNAVHEDKHCPKALLFVLGINAEKDTLYLAVNAIHWRKILKILVYILHVLLDATTE